MIRPEVVLVVWCITIIAGVANGGEPRAATAANRDAIVELGRALFFDDTLSNPTGQSCASCHSPKAGWTFPDASINAGPGIAEGAVATRFGSRRPPTISYVALTTGGAPEFVEERGTYAGGFFYDGRAASLADQVVGPLLDPNEMNNTPEGIVQSVIDGSHASLFKKAFGAKPSILTEEEVFRKVVHAIVNFVNSPILSPFNSTYDAYVADELTLTPSQLKGLQLFTGSKSGRPGGPAVKSAGCWSCHTIERAANGTPDLFTSSTFHNIGIPRNPANSFYSQIDSTTNPQGYNALEGEYVDYGLGKYLYPMKGLPQGNVGKGSNGRGDYLRINGTFKTPTLRNVDSRPTPDFVKCFGHNGYFKSLEQVVHFYNTRNLTTAPGEIINFTERNPYARLEGEPLWPPPEVSDPATLVNPTGVRGLVGNLGLTPEEEENLVAFLRTLSDRPPFAQRRRH